MAVTSMATPPTYMADTGGFDIELQTRVRNVMLEARPNILTTKEIRMALRPYRCTQSDLGCLLWWWYSQGIVRIEDPEAKRLQWHYYTPEECGLRQTAALYALLDAKPATPLENCLLYLDQWIQVFDEMLAL